MRRDSRIERLQGLIVEMGLDGCVLKGMDNIFYLTGFKGSEGMLLVTRGDVVLIVDFRYITHAREVTSGIYVYETKPGSDALYDLCTKYKVTQLGFDGAHVPYATYLTWSESLPGINLVSMNSGIEEIRKNKEPEEIELIRDAISIAERAFGDIAGLVRPGAVEKDIADEFDHMMRKHGAQGPSFNTIVASGPHSALPHAEPTDKKIKVGETVILDFGAISSGYSSDETVTLCIGEIPDKLVEIYTIVNDARKLGIEKAVAGMSIRQLDSIVREYIEEKGYGDYFRHGLGHGVGIAVHEPPAVNSTAKGILEENMIITIEPGIYLPNIGGVRLEDMVLITKDTPRILTQIRKDMIKI